MISLVEVRVRWNCFAHSQLLNFIGQERDLDHTYAGRKEPWLLHVMDPEVSKIAAGCADCTQGLGGMEQGLYGFLLLPRKSQTEY